MIRPFRFNPEKAVEAILYVANRVSEPTFHRIAKILYFADKKHLGDFGRFICGDRYVAMKNGPVPSGSYDIMKGVRGDGFCVSVEHAASAFAVEDRYRISPLREAEISLLSESDTTCLDYAITEYGERSFGELTDISHDKAWQSADENDIISLADIAKMLPDGDSLLEHLSDSYPG